jgi:hypothetical protein
MKTIGYKLALNGKLYKVLHVANKTHPQARAICLADGAVLASAPYGQENIIAMDMLQARSATTNTYFIVDGTDAVTEGTWVLPSGKENPSIYSNRAMT